MEKPQGLSKFLQTYFVCKIMFDYNCVYIDNRSSTERQYIKTNRDYKAIVNYRIKQAQQSVLVHLMNQCNAQSLKREFLRYGPIKVAYQFQYSHSNQVTNNDTVIQECSAHSFMPQIELHYL